MILATQWPTQLLEPLAQFGAAGLVGLLWVWERRLASRREAQLAEAHERIMQQREQLHVLIQLTRRNTRAIARFDRTLHEALRLLRHITTPPPPRSARGPRRLEPKRIA